MTKNDRRVLYVAEDRVAGLVKVGISANPVARIASIQAGNIDRVRLVVQFDPAPALAIDVERLAHARLFHARSCGEWFSVSVEAAHAALVEARDSAIAGDRAPPMRCLPGLATPKPAKPERVGIEPCQVKAARGFLDWSRSDLAKRAGLSVATIERFESGRHTFTRANERLIALALESEGIEFIPANDAGGPGVCLREKAA